MKIQLSPKVAALIKKAVQQCHAMPRDAWSKAMRIRPTTEYHVVNEILWQALREGDIRDHWTKKP